MRSGVALFLVLMSVMMLSAASISLITLGFQARAAIQFSRSDRIMETLHADALALTSHWISEQTQRFSTPIDDCYQPKLVIDSTTDWDSIHCHVTSKVWDACSGIPCFAEDFAWRSFLGSEWNPPSTLVRAETWWLNASSDSGQVFPRAEWRSSEPTPLALAVSAMGDNVVNWRTAPWALVRSVLQYHDGLEFEGSLRQARESASDFRFPNSFQQLRPPYLSDKTSKYCVLVEVHMGTIHRRWFEVLSGKSEPQVSVRYEL